MLHRVSKAEMRSPTTSRVVYTDDVIDARIGVHDANTFEVKLDYAVDPTHGKSHYRIDTYFFLPKSLGINAHTYTGEHFFADVQAYIRFKTPELSLVTILDPHNESSPLARIAEAAPQLLRKPKHRSLRKQVTRELRLFGCAVRAHVRDRVADFRAAARAQLGRVQERAVLTRDLGASITALVEELQGALKSFRELRPTFVRPGMPQRESEAYQYVDEYLSLTVEKHLTSLIEEIDVEDELHEALAETRRGAAELIVAERKHRLGAGYLSALNDPDDSSDERENEHYVYRSGMLKKFVMSVLFLEIRKEKEGRKLGHLVAGVAAAVAMLFAALASLWAQTRYGTNTLPFVVALVISYVFKDRIKEGMKLYFAGRMSRWLYDYNVRIVDPETGVALGRCREAFSFVDRSRVPRDVLARRYADATTTIEPDSKPEVVIHYGKDIRVSNTKVGRTHGRLHDINDIIRVSVASFLARMDDPVRRVRWYNPERDAVEERVCPKTYHVNVVFCRRAMGRQESTALERVRVVLDKNGIRRLEEV